MPEETDLEELRRGTELVKRGFAQMQKGGVIMDVVDAEQARIAEEAGAVAVMALEAVPADIRKRGGVSRMADPETRRDHRRCLDPGDGQGPYRSHCRGPDSGSRWRGYGRRV